MSDEESRHLEAWAKSRSGAWSGRGFTYQHLFTALILVRQWAGLAPNGYVVPEGLEDCVVERSGSTTWIQIKSRRNGRFSKSEVQSVFAGVSSKASTVERGERTNGVVALEQPCSGLKALEVEDLFDATDGTPIVCTSPAREILKLLTTRLRVAEIIAQGILSDLYFFVATCSAENAHLAFDQRRRISTTDVEKRIFERLEAEDPSAIESALRTLALQPVDLETPVREPGFYTGVKAKPGHLAAGLIVSRPEETRDIADRLMTRRQVLVSGQSGAGKSALLWLVARRLAVELRWFQVSGTATLGEAESIVRFVRARRPSEHSPLGLIFDELTSSNCDLWNVLARELRGMSSLFLIGAVRQENRPLVACESDTEFVPVHLSEELADNVWRELQQRQQTTWTHWREPFEQSGGLLLEYVHILTEGDRMAAVIDEQIRERERGGRTDELAIIRCTAALCSLGGEVDSHQLLAALGLDEQRCKTALRRLIDEHIVRESRPGVLGGLHSLRSEALLTASHDEIVHLRMDSLWASLAAATTETLPRIVHTLVANSADPGRTVLPQLARALGATRDVDVWSAILTGLGLVTVERAVAFLIAELERESVPRAMWHFASMFADRGLDLPTFLEADGARGLRVALDAYRNAPHVDLRRKCIEMLPDDSRAPVCESLTQANRLLSSLIGLAGGGPIRANLTLDFDDAGECDIDELTALLSTAYEVEEAVAIEIVSALGGERTLLDWFYRQTPWSTQPTIDSDGEHGRTVRSDWFLPAEQYQPDPHDTVCEICTKLLALSPTSDAAASDAVDPGGQRIQVGGYALWSKNIPRGNMHARTRVAWNVAFRQITLAKSTLDSATVYAQKMTRLVKRTEVAFRAFTERWIVGKGVGDRLAKEIERVCSEVGAIAYAGPSSPAASMTVPESSDISDDTLGALLTGVLGNLVSRIRKLSDEQGPKGLASFGCNLAEQARTHRASDIWRMTASPPTRELEKLADRLQNVGFILHEICDGDSSRTSREIRKATKRSGLDKRVQVASRRCLALANRRFSERQRRLEKELKAQGCRARCCTRPLDESDSFRWPPREVAILIEVSDLVDELDNVEKCIEVGTQVLKEDWDFRVVPVMDGVVVVAMAFGSWSSGMYRDAEFASRWQSHIDRPFMKSSAVDDFDAAIAACTALSSIVHCRGVEDLRPSEEEALGSAIEAFRIKHQNLVSLARQTEHAGFTGALELLEELWDEVASEFDAAIAGGAVDTPFWLNSRSVTSVESSELLRQIAWARSRLCEAACESALG